jgi:cytochrome c oxidase cbb3-type subunit III
MTAIRSLRMVALIFGLGLVSLAPSADAQFAPPPIPPHSAHPKATPESVSQGKDLFAGTCANCHGIDGSGANGPNIQGVGGTLGPESLYATIRGGVPGTGMPPFATLDDATIWKIVDYVSSLGHENAGVATGDPQKGKAIYESNGCSSCHTIDARGGDIGPDLSHIGAQRSIVTLEKTLTDPGSNLPLDTSLQERSAYPAYMMYRAVKKDGKVVEGMRVDEDSFTMQLRDSSGHIQSIQKFEVQKIEPEPRKSFMPSYKDKLSATQINDLVAYLSSLGGAQ